MFVYSTQYFSYIHRLQLCSTPNRDADTAAARLTRTLNASNGHTTACSVYKAAHGEKSRRVVFLFARGVRPKGCALHTRNHLHRVWCVRVRELYLHTYIYIGGPVTAMRSLVRSIGHPVSVGQRPGSRNAPSNPRPIPSCSAIR